MMAARFTAFRWKTWYSVGDVIFTLASSACAGGAAMRQSRMTSRHRKTLVVAAGVTSRLLESGGLKPDVFAEASQTFAETDV
jgi:hypothetical protein